MPRYLFKFVMKIIHIGVSYLLSHLIYLHPLRQQFLRFFDPNSVEISVEVFPRVVFKKLAQVRSAVIKQSRQHFQPQIFVVMAVYEIEHALHFVVPAGIIRAAGQSFHNCGHIADKIPDIALTVNARQELGRFPWITGFRPEARGIFRIVSLAK